MTPYPNMPPSIKEKDLILAQQYVEQIKNGNFSDRKPFSAEENNEFIPAVRNLFLCGKKNVVKELPSDKVSLFSQWYDSTTHSYNLTRGIVMDNLSEVEGLIAACERQLKSQSRHDLFNKKIVEMTGYQFEQYLKELKLLS